MATKKGVGRIVHFANLPLKLLLPNSRENITEVAFKTIPSASKIEIKRVLETLYGLQVAKVNTLNMEGKKKRAKGSLAFYRRPDYKKAYVTLKEPVSLPANLFPLNMVKEEEAPEDKPKQ
ncbi:uncharacterized protein [Physcomitrium patens]|uniref:Large ribosomal subunit protein uL23m n=1 Tax=Physcomitrium patens TaxID=3218 RepID=A0A2K1L815_PHYPA|nr:uncharacterized protein LOC112287596 [Physcomitrium patens]PNR62185.1 hypothetical protein PHYPA_000609 [Physcomitrium patens]|eukprot:XP_024386517.1 uncharacterized protein LOC112287596 [Physcomitrella patens]